MKVPAIPNYRRRGLAAGRLWLCVAAFSAVLASVDALAQLAAESYESPPQIRPDQILPAAMLTSGNHRVLDEVDTKQNFLEFEVESDFGNYRPISVAMLSIRVHEIRTLAQAVDQYNRNNKQLAEELRGQLTVGADSFVEILTSPISTTTQIVGQFTSNVGQTFNEFGDFVPQTPQGDKSSINIYEQFEPGDPILASHKRNVASQLNLDLYSSNPRVQDFLDTLATARSSGQLSAGIVTISLPSDGQVKVAGGSIDAAVRGAMTQNTIDRLYRRNFERMTAAGVSEDVANNFLSHPMLSPTHKTEITEHLVFLEGIGNKDALPKAALGTTSENEAVAYVQVARTLSSYHERIEPIGELVSAGHIVLATTLSGGIVVVLPFDIIYWDPETQRIFSGLADFADQKGFRHRGIITPGIFTDVVSRQLGQIDVDLNERFLQRP
jgi:hypothetical protein